MIVTLAICCFGIAGLCGACRLLIGPGLADRVMALDVTLISLMGAIAVDAGRRADATNLVLVVVLAMSLIASILMLAGGRHRRARRCRGAAVLHPYARFHAAGKASPVAFLVAAPGAGLEVGLGGAATLVVAAAAMTLTLPVGVHLLFRAVHRTTPGDHLRVDELAPVESVAEAAAQERARPDERD